MTTLDLADERAETTWQTLRRGLSLSPELRTGLAGTLFFAVISMAGRAAVPIAVQQGIDRGLAVPDGPDLGVVATVAAITAAVLVVTTVCGYLMMRRLFTVSETALAGVRTRTFRHVHDLSMLHQQSERRGSLTSRVTSDVDQITQFLQWGGVILLISVGQVVVTSIVMAIYSWQLTLVTIVAFLPVIPLLRFLQRRQLIAYDKVRTCTGDMLAEFSESITGAAAVRAYGLEGRSRDRLHERVHKLYLAHREAGRYFALMFPVGDFFGSIALAAVVALSAFAGVELGLDLGTVVAFAFP